MATVAATSESGPIADRARSVRSALAVEWREVGGLGRLATAGLLVSGIVAIVLGLWIQASVHRHLLQVRTELLQGIVDDLTTEQLLPLGESLRVPKGTIDAAVEHRLIGGEIVGVAIYDATGVTVYGDPSGTDMSAALAGGGLPHVEQHRDGLLHFLLPVQAPDGRVLGRLEVFQQATSFNEVLARVRRNVWLSISTGLAMLGIAMGAFTVAHGRVLDRRRRHAEQLLRDLLRIEDRERHRIVGALHDDVGQPLYRLLYGLEGCRARLDDRGEIDAELRRLTSLVREVDSTLRDELHKLHRSGVEALDLMSGLEAAARDCREECGLSVEVAGKIRSEPPTVVRSVLLRAVQEGLVNVRKHAQASAVSIHADSDGRQVAIEVVDDGVGPTGLRGLGLTTAAARLDSLGGGLALGRTSAGGTVLRVWAPLDGEVKR